MKSLLLITVLALIAGCDYYQVEPREKNHGATHIQIWRDQQRGVTCWIYGSSDGGISCLPDGVLRK